MVLGRGGHDDDAFTFSRGNVFDLAAVVVVDAFLFQAGMNDRLIQMDGGC